MPEPASVLDRIPIDDPWSALPSGLAPLLRRGSDMVATDIVREIRRAIPEYALVLNGPHVERARAGIQVALNQFVDQVADPTASRDRCAETFRKFGRYELAGGRSLDALQAAYRIGARVAWRHFVSLGQRLRLSMPTMCLLGEAMFAHIDELAMLSADGYATAQARAAGVVERRRRRLLEVLLAEPAVPFATARELAANSAWPLPERVRAVALEPGPEQLPDLPDAVLVDLERAEPCLLAPESVDAVQLSDALRDCRVALGPPVRLADSARSLRWARRALELVRRGMLPDVPVTDCATHLATLVLLGDEPLVSTLAERALSPLAGLTPKQRDRLARTLLCWLQTRGGAPEIATRLGVHPQTVRHRMHQLQEHFGPRLDDPNARFELEIALRARFPQ